MAKLVLHIGTHKTGTTALQDAFHANRAVLAEHGIIYPSLGAHTGHHGLLTDWLALPAPYSLPAGGIGTLSQLIEDVVGTHQTLFLSSEEFSRGGGGGGQVNMAQLRQIADGFDSVQVICFLREQWQFLQSVYLEIARTRVPDRPPVLIEVAQNTDMTDGLWCDYGLLYDHLLTGFAPQEICFYDYDRACGRPGGIIGAVLDAIQAPLGAQDLLPVNGGKSNVSARALPVWAGFAIAGGHPANAGLFAASETAFDFEFGPDHESCLFTRAEFTLLARHFAPLNRALQNRLKPTQPDFAISHSVPGPAALYREDVTADLWLRAARRIYLGAGAG